MSVIVNVVGNVVVNVVVDVVGFRDGDVVGPVGAKPSRN